MRRLQKNRHRIRKMRNGSRRNTPNQAILDKLKYQKELDHVEVMDITDGLHYYFKSGEVGMFLHYLRHFYHRDGVYKYINSNPEHEEMVAMLKNYRGKQ